MPLPVRVVHVSGQSALPPCVLQFLFCFSAFVGHDFGQRAVPPCMMQFCFCFPAWVGHVGGQREYILFFGCTSTSLLASFLFFAGIDGTIAAVVSMEWRVWYWDDSPTLSYSVREDSFFLDRLEPAASSRCSILIHGTRAWTLWVSAWGEIINRVNSINNKPWTRPS